MERALIVISVAIAVTRAYRDGLISHSLRQLFYTGAEVEYLRDLSVSLVRKDLARSDGIADLAAEVDLAGGWSVLIAEAPAYARETWAATVETLRS